jgi:hypothetical protein
MDMRVTPSALTGYMLLSKREAVMFLFITWPILLLASLLFNRLVRDHVVM